MQKKIVSLKRIRFSAESEADKLNWTESGGDLFFAVYGRSSGVTYSLLAMDEVIELSSRARWATIRIFRTLMNHTRWNTHSLWNSTGETHNQLALTKLNLVNLQIFSLLTDLWANNHFYNHDKTWFFFRLKSKRFLCDSFETSQSVINKISSVTLSWYLRGCLDVRRSGIVRGWLSS